MKPGLLLFIALVLPCAAIAQERWILSDQATSSIGLGLDTPAEAIVIVTVSDDKGRPVESLKAANFEVREFHCLNSQCGLHPLTHEFAQQARSRRRG